MKSIASKIRRDIKYFGVARTAYEVFMTGINLCLFLTIFRVFKNEVSDPDFPESNEAFQWQFFDESQMLRLAQDPPNTGLDESFVQTALKKGDECHGCFDGKVLAYYRWYSNKPTEHSGLTFYFRSDYMYQYAGFTLPKYRGRRLSGIGRNRALREYLGRGFKGTVSIIESHNFRSLRSATRSGFQDIGYIFVLKIGRHAWIHTSRGCREHGFSLANSPVAEPDSKAR